MRALILKIADVLARWHHKHLSAIDFAYVLAVIIGLLCGVACGVLKNAVDLVTRLVFSHIHLHSSNLVFLFLPIAGIFIATLFTRYVVRKPMDHASERIVDDMANNTSNLSPKLIVGPIIGCAFTLGLGGSAGAEDPIAYTGAAIGSNVGKSFGLPPESLSTMVGCGAAAAIGGIFMAPIGGVMFALEVLKMKQDLTTVLTIVLSSLISALTCYIMLGCHADVTFVPEMAFKMDLIPYVILAGVVCGLYSLYYRATMARLRKVYQRRTNIWVRAALGAVTMGVLLFVFPSLYGEGYSLLSQLMLDRPLDVVRYGPLYHLGLHFDVLLLLMVALLIVKPIATSATNDSGGIGGDFTPTFYCGGILGFLFAVTLNHFFGLQLPYALFAFFGMAGVMSGAIKAPLMAIFIAAEMTSLYGFILPLTIAAMASLLTTVLFSGLNIPNPLTWMRHKL